MSPNHTLLYSLLSSKSKNVLFSNLLGFGLRSPFDYEIYMTWKQSVSSENETLTLVQV